MNDSSSFGQWVNLLPAIATAGAAWLGFVLSLYTWWQSHPSRKVKVACVRWIHPAPEPYGGLIAVTFMNERGPSVVVQEVGFLCADPEKWIVKDEFLVPHDDHLPKEVPSGHSANYYFDLEKLQRVVQEGKSIVVRAYCRDATQHVHKSQFLNRYLSQQINSALLE